MSEYQNIIWKRTRIFSYLDFVTEGKRLGDVMFKYSDNQYALGCVTVPAGVIVNGSGPTVLLIGGVHGDEFEGPVALLKFLHQTDHKDINGRIIVFPALNAPAVNASSRVSPLDNVNLNRAFPGDCDGTPTQMIADFIENSVMPVCDAVIDLHAGGKASWFEPCSMAMLVENDSSLTESNFQLAESFGCPLIWVMGQLNDKRSVNAAAHRNAIPSMAAELGGGGQVSPHTLKIGEQGIANCLKEIGILSGPPKIQKDLVKYVGIKAMVQQIHSPTRGIFEPDFSPGDYVTEGDSVGYVHNLDHIEKPPLKVIFPCDGIAYVRTHRGMVDKGDLLTIVGEILDPEAL